MMVTNKKELWITLKDKKTNEDEFFKTIDITGKIEGEIEELKGKALKAFGAAYRVEFELQEI